MFVYVLVVLTMYN